MDLFQHRYYAINKILMSIIGIWPYQATCLNRTFITIILLLKISAVVPNILVIVKYHNDWSILVDCIAPLLMVTANFLKIIFFSWNSQEMMQLLNCIRTNWEAWAEDEEINILHEYAEKGRKMTIVYAVSICFFAVLYAAPPIAPKIIDVLLKNGSETGEFPFPVDYYRLDKQKYYFYILMHLALCGAMEAIYSIATDTVFMVFIQHGCSLFSALGHKLQRTGNNEKTPNIDENVYELDMKSVNYNHLSSCIDRHNDVIEYAGLMEAIYSWYLFFMVGCTIFGISITGLQIIYNLKHQQGMTRYISALVINMVHMYIDSYICQKFIDHSISVSYNIFNSNWYNLSSKDLKVLQLIIMRSNIPCNLTAGKIFVMSVESFAVILKTSLSYFTVLRTV